MSKENFKDFFKTKFFKFCILYAFVFLVSSYFKYLEILLIPILIWAFVSLDIEQDFYFFLFTQPFYTSQLLSRPAIISEVIYVVVLLVRFIIGVKQNTYQLYKKLGILIIAFTIYTLLISLFHEMAIYSITYIFYLPIFYIIFSTRKEYNLEKIARTVVYSLIFSCLISLFILPITSRETCYRIVDGSFRFRGFYGSANTLYMTALLGLSCFMYLFFKKRIDFKEYIVNYFILAILSLLTSSKANIVILAFITLISIFCYLKDDFKRHIWQIVVACILLLLLLLIFKDFTLKIIDRFLSVDTADFLNSLSTGRMDIWTAYANEIFDNPLKVLFGHGMLSKYAYVPAQGRDRAQHNLYIFLLYKFGIVGIIFLFLIIRQFIKDSGKYRPSFINFIPLIYFLIGAMVDNSFMYPQFYIIVAFVLFDTETNLDEQFEKLSTKTTINPQYQIQNQQDD